MLKLLLHEHISPAVADSLRRRNPRVVVECLSQWEDGAFLGQEDQVCLRAAANQAFTLVTYDRRTIPPLLKLWAEQGKSHGGVIFVDEKTIAPAEIGALVAALLRLLKQGGDRDWTDRICFLRR
jgi:hypothetical protein